MDPIGQNKPPVSPTDSVSTSASNTLTEPKRTPTPPIPDRTYKSSSQATPPAVPQRPPKSSAPPPLYSRADKPSEPPPLPKRETDK